MLYWIFCEFTKIFAGIVTNSLKRLVSKMIGADIVELDLSCAERNDSRKYVCVRRLDLGQWADNSV